MLCKCQINGVLICYVSTKLMGEHVFLIICYVSAKLMEVYIYLCFCFRYLQ